MSNKHKIRIFIFRLAWDHSKSAWDGYVGSVRIESLTHYPNAQAAKRAARRWLKKLGIQNTDCEWHI